MKVIIEILKIILGIILGLVLSFVTILCINAYEESSGRFILHTWLIALIIAGWLFLVLWLLLRRLSAKELQTKDIEHLPKSISELIDGIIDAMRYRRSVRAEVRQELTDHFTDALAGCKTEEEKQAATKELIEAFGDVELLGKLLRRAKKRCRPMWRTMVVRFFQLVGICFVLLILYIGWFFTGKPQITTNYLEIMNQQVRPVADDSQNAWPLYQQAAQIYQKPGMVKIEAPPLEENETGPMEPYEMEPYGMEPLVAEEEDFDQIPRTLETLSEQERDILQQWISDNQEPLELIVQGNKRSCYWQVYGMGENNPHEMLAMLLPHLSEYKKLANLMCWQGLLSAEQGDFEKTFDIIFEAYSFGDHLRGQNTTLIEQLVAWAIEKTSLETLRIVLSEYDGKYDASILNGVRERYAILLESKDFSIDFDAEKLYMYDEAQRCFTQSRFGKSHLYFPRLQMLTDNDIEDQWELVGPRAFQFLFTHPDKEETLREVEKFYTELENISKMTPATVRLKGLHINGVEEMIEKNIFLSILMPALSKINQLAWRTRAETEATLAILAILQYEQEHGELSESLDILVAKGLLDEVPIDLFSDKPFAYRRTEDGFTLYSVGLNFTDDGGVPGTDEDGEPRRWGNHGDRIFWLADVQ